MNLTEHCRDRGSVGCGRKILDCVIASVVAPILAKCDTITQAELASAASGAGASSSAAALPALAPAPHFSAKAFVCSQQYQPFISDVLQSMVSTAVPG